MTDDFSHYYAVIMAGGGGTRLWPLSREARPKQMLNLFDERSLFQTSIYRLFGVFSPENIFVVTVADQVTELHAQVPELSLENFIVEPKPKGTASVIGLAAIVLNKRDPLSVMAVLTSDHFIGNEEKFRDILRTAYYIAEDGFLVTLGIEPTFPATGFGYIERGKFLQKYAGYEVFQVAGFKEKPEESLAQLFLADKKYSWNSGMFFWQVDRILDEFERQLPDLAAGLSQISLTYGSPAYQFTLERVWADIPVRTIDYGIMEGAHDVTVLPAIGLDWNDVGSWDSLFDVIPSDKDGNIVVGGTHIGLDTQQSLVYMNKEHRLIVTIGVNNLIVVDTGDVILVCRKDQAQKVRQIVMQLKQSGQEYI